MNESAAKAYSEPKKLLLIYNPVSGKKAALRLLPDAIRIFSENGFAVTVYPTEKQGDAARHAELYADKFNSIVCIGGDGTLNETVCGLIKNGTDIPLGYIPAGSTNDFAACHGISSDVNIAAQNILRGNIKEIDVGNFEGRSFTYVAAFGAFCDLSYNTPQGLKNVLGHSAYLLDAVRDLPKIKSRHLKFRAEDHVFEGDYIFGAVCNSTSVAGTIKLPDSIVDTGDGKFEVLLVHEPHNVIDFNNLLGGILTKDYSSPFLDFFQTSSLEIAAPERLEWAIDGERYVSNGTVNVSISKRKLRLLN